MQFTHGADVGVRAASRRQAAPLWRRSCGQVARWSAMVVADFMRGPAAAEAPSAAPAPVRYRHPVRGDTWDGRGLQPQWLRDAVLHEGYLLCQLRCPGAQALS